MKQQLEKRLKELRVEFESGQKMMAELESKQASLRDTLLRISGAIQVLEELIANVNSTGEMQGQAGQKEQYADQKAQMGMEVLE